jgi:hypothetical protein
LALDSSHYVEEYADSIRNEVWFGGVSFPKKQKLLIAILQTNLVSPEGLELELNDDDPQTASVTFAAIASTKKRAPRFVKIFDREQLKTAMNGIFTGKVVWARMKGFAPDLNTVIHSNRVKAPRE